MDARDDQELETSIRIGKEDLTKLYRRVSSSGVKPRIRAVAKQIYENALSEADSSIGRSLPIRLYALSWLWGAWGRLAMLEAIIKGDLDD